MLLPGNTVVEVTRSSNRSDATRKRFIAIYPKKLPKYEQKFFLKIVVFAGDDYFSGLESEHEHSSRQHYAAAIIQLAQPLAILESKCNFVNIFVKYRTVVFRPFIPTVIIAELYASDQN